MANDIMSQYYASYNLTLRDRLKEISRIIDQSGPYKDLQMLFPQLISNIFGVGSVSNWGLRQVTFENNYHEFSLLHEFLDPQGPMFRLCYKLLVDPMLKYTLQLQSLPFDLQQMLHRGRYPQFYADLLNVDTQNISQLVLALNPFDYYIFHFALHLLTNVNRCSWDTWNTVYFALARDYLMHFLPTDANCSVLPNISYYSGKAPVIAPLQTPNRSLHTPSLLLIQDLPGLNSQNSPNSSQSQQRNEVWRTETVLQVFMDIWLNVDECSINDNCFPRITPLPNTSSERVRVSRMLVKQIHMYASKHLSDPMPRSASLRKYARQTLSIKAYMFVKHLMSTWPLDSSFRLVLELWLSLIQPWRYAHYEGFGLERIGDRYPNEDENIVRTVDISYMQYIAENLPSYTTLFQLVLPRFLRLDLTTPKNAVMLFRVCKVFSQEGLVPMLMETERAAIGTDFTIHRSPGGLDSSYPSNKLGAVAKQAIAEFNQSSTIYEPMWGERTRQDALELLRRMGNARVASENLIHEIELKIHNQNKNFWSYLWKMWNVAATDDDISLEERKKVPNLLLTSMQQWSSIFGLQDDMVLSLRTPVEERTVENSSFMSASHFPISLSPEIRNKSLNIKYMGDPDLAPITSYESTILVRLLYQISTKINELYGREMAALYERDDFWGYVTREVLQKPCQIHTYLKGGPNHGKLVHETLPPRISLRRMSSYRFVIWLSLGYLLFKLFGYSGFTYVTILIFFYVLVVFFVAGLKTVGLLSTDQDHVESNNNESVRID